MSTLKNKMDQAYEMMIRGVAADIVAMERDDIRCCYDLVKFPGIKLPSMTDDRTHQMVDAAVEVGLEQEAVIVYMEAVTYNTYGTPESRLRTDILKAIRDFQSTFTLKTDDEEVAA